MLKVEYNGWENFDIYTGSRGLRVGRDLDLRQCLATNGRRAAVADIIGKFEGGSSAAISGKSHAFGTREMEGAKENREKRK